jgi:uncharacterized protein (DUF58 family)
VILNFIRGFPDRRGRASGEALGAGLDSIRGFPDRRDRASGEALGAGLDSIRGFPGWRDRASASGKSPGPGLTEILRHVRLLEIHTRHLVKDVFAGEYSSVFKGRGVEFSDVREYQPGDDIRTIDWNVTARMGSPFVKQYVEERELTVMFLVDHSSSEVFGSRVRLKSDLAAEVCAVLAMTAVRNNDRVGAVLFTDRVERFVPPKKGKKHVLRVIRELLSFEPRGSGTDLASALEFVNRVLRRRAVIFIVSDFLTAGYELVLKATARRHDTIAVQLRDPRERELPDVGLLALRDPESDRWGYVDTGSRFVRDRFRHQVDEFDGALGRFLRRQGVDLIRLETGQTYVDPLLAFFRMRERMQRR